MGSGLVSFPWKACSQVKLVTTSRDWLILGGSPSGSARPQMSGHQIYRKKMYDRYTVVLISTTLGTLETVTPDQLGQNLGKIEESSVQPVPPTSSSEARIRKIGAEALAHPQPGCGIQARSHSLHERSSPL